MKKIVQYVGEYYRSSFSRPAFLLLCIFLAGSIAVNYSWQFETKFIGHPQGTLLSFGKYALFYLLPFAFAFALEAAFKPESSYLRRPEFWLLLAAGPVLFASRELSLLELIGIDAFGFWGRIGGVLLDWVVAGLPIYFYWRATRERGEPLYGFSQGSLDLRPYWVMLALMAPLIAVASFQSDFLHAYPRAETISGAPGGEPASWLHYLVFEILYGLDFVFIEFFFRGFLILALAKHCGRAVILPMAAFYVFIHFEKPMGEAISSFFGGMLLGIVTYETRSILGGIIVHVGIAWLMELFAFGQKAIL